MEKPLHEFGGWLRFFQVTNIIGVIVLLPMIVFLIIFSLAMFEIKQFISSSAVVVDLLISFYLILRILKILKVINTDTPGKIMKYLVWFIIFTLIFMVIEIFVALWVNGGGWTSADNSSVRASIGSMFSCIIWISYFKNSKRVKQVYTGTSEDLRISGILS